MLSSTAVPCGPVTPALSTDRTATEPSGFTMIPDALLCDPDLSYGAKTLYAIILHHARPDRGGFCTAGYERLCLLMNAGEDLVRATLRELRARNLVVIQRRGQGRTNIIRPVFVVSSRTRRHRVLDTVHTLHELEREEPDQRESFDHSTCPSTLPDPSLRDDHGPADARPQPQPPILAAVPHVPETCAARTARKRQKPISATPDPIRSQLTPYVRDVARELRDHAPLPVSVTRVCNLQKQSGLPTEAFIERMQNARQITQERSAAIRDRDRSGLAYKFAYWCEVLRDQCGLREGTPTNAPIPPPVAASPRDAGTAEEAYPGTPLPQSPQPRAVHPRTPAGAEKSAALYNSLAPFGVHEAGGFIRRYGFGPFGDYEDALARALQWERRYGDLRGGRGVVR